MATLVEASLRRQGRSLIMNDLASLQIGGPPAIHPRPEAKIRILVIKAELLVQQAYVVEHGRGNDDGRKLAKISLQQNRLIFRTTSVVIELQRGEIPAGAIFYDFRQSVRRLAIADHLAGSDYAQTFVPAQRCEHRTHHMVSKC